MKNNQIKYNQGIKGIGVYIFDCKNIIVLNNTIVGNENIKNGYHISIGGGIYLQSK